MRLHATRRAAIAQGRGLGDPLWDLAGVPPSLDQRFAESKSLIDAVSGQQLITFTRQSDRSIITSTGGMDIIGTATAGFTHDPFTLESLGLFLEEPRPNLLLNSAAPASQNITVAATAYTLSFYGSGDIVLTGAHSATVIGTGVFPNRRVLTFTPTAGTLGVTVSGTVEFANLEPGSFATSWIPTGASQATRSADVASITGSAFSGFYNQTEGTILASGFRYGTADGRFAGFDSGSISDAYVLTASSVRNVVISSVSNGGFGGGVTTANSFAYLAPIKAAATFSSADNETACLNGGAVASGAATAPSASLTTMRIGAQAGPAGFYNGTIRRLTYWPQRLPNSTLQNITL
jgi:hypothetical protein